MRSVILRFELIWQRFNQKNRSMGSYNQRNSYDSKKYLQERWKESTQSRRFLLKSHHFDHFENEDLDPSCLEKNKDDGLDEIVR